MTLQPRISEQFNGAIWRIEVDGLSNTLFVEVRNNEDKRVSFGAINLVSGTTYFKGLAVAERWLTGLEAAYNGVMLIHNYQSEAGPAHKGLVAIEGKSAKTLWSNYTIALDHLSTKGPIVFDPSIHPRKLFLADIASGATTRIYEPSVYKALKNDIVLPHMVTPDFLPSGSIGVHPFGDRIHYLEYNNFRIVSLHALKGGLLTQAITITDAAGTGGFRNEVVYNDLLNEDIQKEQPEAFIMHKNYLIYIKNKSELKVLVL